MEPIQTRFLSKVGDPGEDGCWLWTAFRNPDGYGMFWLAGGMRLAHRVAYELFIGEIPAGYIAHHKCETPACVNPDHLVLMVRGDHVRLHMPSERCRRGHPLVRKSGRPYCLECSRARTARYRERRARVVA